MILHEKKKYFDINVYIRNIFYIFAAYKVLSGLAHVKLMPVGGWCDKRFCRMKNAKITVSSFGNGSIEQVFEYANHGLFHSFLGDYAL